TPSPSASRRIVMRPAPLKGSLRKTSPFGASAMKRGNCRSRANTFTVNPAGTVSRCPSGIATTRVGLRNHGVWHGGGSCSSRAASTQSVARSAGIARQYRLCYSRAASMFGLFYPYGIFLQALAILHFVRRRPDTFWFWIILFGGGLGALVYIMVEVIPDVRL